MPTNFVDEQGRRVTLGERIGPRGGEGEIFRVQDEAAAVAKVYHRPADARKAEKLRRLRSLSQPSLLNLAAWPERLIFDAGNRHQVAGFVMPFREGRRIERLYSPRDRLTDFPKAGWDFLLGVAWNCAAAFETLHEHDVLMADVNEGNVLVTDNGLVRLIDCDSYQVPGANGHPLTCDVGAALWTPPELQGRSLAGVVRTADHDRFGLAVLIFHLLFMGRHPYAGVPLSDADDDLQLEGAIARDRFAFGSNHRALGIRPPPHLLTPAELPSAVGQLFERAFAPLNPLSTNTGRNRPTGREWASTLGTIIVRRCTSNPLHTFPESTRDCPWCRIYQDGGPRFFAVLIAAGGATAIQIETLWRLIATKVPAALPIRGLSAYPIPPIQAVPCPPDLKPRREGFGQWLLMTFCGAGPINPDYQRERERREARVTQSRAELDRVLAAARAVGAEYQRHFKTKYKELDALYGRHRALENERAAELRKLELQKYDILLKNFLDSRLIANATIKGIGVARKAALKVCGIESALDIRANLRAPGIGPAYRNALLGWRARVEAQFRYNPATPLPASEIAALDQRMRDSRLELESRLRNGPTELDRLAGQARQALLRVEDGIPNLVRAHAQAVADLQRVPPPN